LLYTNNPDEHAPLGVQVVNDIGISATAPSVVNAVFHVTVLGQVTVSRRTGGR
jgi:hypothetical protein